MMKDKFLNRAKKHLQSLGYKFEAHHEWYKHKYGAISYLRKGAHYYAVTVATCTGQLLIEVLKRKELIRVVDPEVEI